MGSLDHHRTPKFLSHRIGFPDGDSYELIKPLTDFRKCHDGRPLEARIVFTCKLVGSSSPSSEQGQGLDESEYVMKVKVQAPDAEQPPVSGPSSTTAHELKALQTFTKANSPFAPHLKAWKAATQGPDGIFPGGYITYTVMTKMPGQDLLALQYWNLPSEKREEIVSGFLEALRAIYELGIEPVDCALRNVLWESETKRCTIIDFELWRDTTETFADETKELERWGLAKRKPPISWWAEWNMQGR